MKLTETPFQDRICRTRIEDKRRVTDDRRRMKPETSKLIKLLHRESQSFTETHKD